MSEKKKQVKIITDLKETRPFHLSTPYLLKYDNTSLFTKEFMRRVQFILGDPIEFDKKKSQEQQKIQDQLEDLYSLETRWKVLVKKSLHSSKFVKELYSHGYLQFRKLFKEHFYPVGENIPEREIKKRLAFKSSSYCQHVFKHLLEKKKLFPFFITDLTADQVPAEFFEEKIKKIDPDEWFCEIVKICMKKSYEEGIDIAHRDKKSFLSKELGDDCLKAKRTDLHYPIREYLSLYLAAQLLDILSERHLLIDSSVDKRVEYLRQISFYMRGELSSYATYASAETRWVGIPDELSYALLKMLAETEVVLRVEKQAKIIRSGKVSDVIIYVFDRKMDSSLGWSENLPRITPPPLATEDSVKQWISPVRGGTSEAEVSDQAMLSLNIQQKKKFKINENFLKILEQRDRLPTAVEFPTTDTYLAADADYRAWMKSDWHNCLTTCLFNGTKTILNLKEPRKKDRISDYVSVTHSDLIRICSMSYGEAHITSKKFLMHESVSTLRGRRQLILTNQAIGQYFSNFPIYFSSKLDYRFRMYPTQYLLSRTSGFLKYSLHDFNPTRVTKTGLYNMLEAYYTATVHCLEDFKAYFVTGNRTWKLLVLYFHYHKLGDIKNFPIYFELLEKELIKITTAKTPEGKKTALSLEIDQVGSGPMLVALLTGNKKLAQKCNMTGGELQCVYTYVQQEAVKYLEKNYEELCLQAPEALDFLGTSRKATKFTLMCFFYNQKHLNRTTELKIRFEENKSRALTDSEFQLFSRYSIEFEKFIDEIFPGLSNQLNLLEKAMLLLVQHQKPIQLRTLDDCLLTWDFGFFATQKRTVWNPISRKSEPFSISVFSKEHTRKTLKTRQNKHTRTFRANLIHSIDGGLMRYFITETYVRSRYRINHLHDCILVHCNYADVVFEVIRDAYCRPEMRNLAADLVFSQFKSQTRGTTQKEIAKLEQEFCENMDSFEFLNRNEFDPRKCYKYEGV